MANPEQALEGLKTGLAAALPTRIVTRDFVQRAQRRQEDLLKGVLCIVSQGEQGYANYVGREADLGRLKVLLVGQILLPGSPSGLAVERAELAFAEEIKAFLGSELPSPVTACLATGFVQSGQMEVPDGWIVFETEVEYG